jgi:RHS repeat-associated protein
VITNYAGGVEATISSLPFGDAETISGSDGEWSDYAGMDGDAESGTEHAQFRQYEQNHAHWMSPDPYLGSYDFTNPQSFNRYSYALNDPVAFSDPTGLAPTCTINPTTGNLQCTSGFPSCDTDTNQPGCGQPPPGCAFIFNAQGEFEGQVCLPTGNQPAPGQQGSPGQQSSGGGGSATNNINCGTKLPNGQTVGDYVRAARNQMNSIQGTGSPPLDAYHMLTTFKGLVGGGSSIDFKNTMAGQAPIELLGNAGNFAYYAIGSGYFSAGILDMGAGGYAIKSAFIPSSPVTFSALTMPYGQDTSAKLQEGPGLAANGCGVKTF